MRWFRKPERTEVDGNELRAIVANNVGIAALLPEDDLDRLVQLTSSLMVGKRWEPIKPLVLTNEILVTVAANAAIPVLQLGIGAYRNVRSICLHGGVRRSTELRAGPAAGLVTDSAIMTVGQASPNAGPVSISWDAALADSGAPFSGRNVVIHEFAHKLDMLDGYSDGTPPLATGDRRGWEDLLGAEYARIEPDASDSVLRPYAWTNPAEFFAVSSEVFFTTPQQLYAAKPNLYAALAGFYRQDPVTRWRLDT